MRTKLPPKFKEKWLEALRSGDYDQCQSQLHEEGGFCCLGVAGIICGHSIEFMGDQGVFTKDQFKGNYKKLRIPSCLKGSPVQSKNLEPVKDFNQIVKTLTDMNDGGDTFDDIADWVEINL